MRILVADDSRTTLALIVESLKKMGHSVIAVSNGFKAIESYKDKKPDLIILDVIMEGMDGFECAKRIRNIDVEAWIPIIFLSGAVDDENIAKGIDAGGDDYLTKPFSELTLASKIKAMQRISDMRQNLYRITKKLKKISTTDRLTGLYNRLQFEKTIRQKTTEALQNKQSIALLFLDLDNFKTINDTLGHHMGDMLLRQVATRLKSCLRMNDFIARIGGDEFAVILNNIENPKIVSDISQKIIYIIDQPYKLGGVNVSIGVSIGIAYYPSNDTNPESLVINADVAMYYAKSIGRNNYQFFNEELGAQYNKQVDLKNELKIAVDRRELFLKYQPIYDLNTHKIVRVEALINWLHPEFGIIPASVFIPIAEELGLIDGIEKWVLLKVCEQTAEWIKVNISPVKLSVNISPRELLQKDFPEFVATTIKKVNIPAELIEFEITETSVLIYSELSQQIIKKINSIGVGIVLVDFGTGYSSLMHLKNLQINAIKIDKLFVDDAIDDKHTEMLVKSIIDIGNNLKFDVIAVGIETEEQLGLLIKLGCPQGQGYYLDKPLDAKEIVKLLEKSKQESAN